MKKHFSLAGLVVALAIFLFPLLPEQASACSCVPPSPVNDSLQQADAVFLGRVTDIDRPLLKQNSLESVRVRFAPDEYWKLASPQARIDVYTGQGGGDCGFTFTPDETYLVYANESAGRLTTSICSRTALAATAQTDLDTLGEGADIDSQQSAFVDVVSPDTLIWTGAIILVIIGGLGLYRLITVKPTKKR